jgi:hypothetical protein
MGWALRKQLESVTPAEPEHKLRLSTESNLPETPDRDSIDRDNLDLQENQSRGKWASFRINLAMAAVYATASGILIAACFLVRHWLGR